MVNHVYGEAANRSYFDVERVELKIKKVSRVMGGNAATRKDDK